MNEISRTALIKHRMKVNKNVLVSELEPMALIYILKDSKAFDKLAIESVVKVNNNLMMKELKRFCHWWRMGIQRLWRSF